MDLIDFLETTQDPWQCTAIPPLESEHYDAFIGNGRIGIRVPIEGETSSYPEFIPPHTSPGGTLMHGLWSMNSLIPAFNFMQLELKVNGMRFRRDSAGEWRNYRQTLDWRTATVTTYCDWVLDAGTVHVEYTIHLDYQQKSLGVVELALESDFDGVFTVIDRVDASFITELYQGKTHFSSQICPATAKVFSARVGIHNRLVAAATQLNLETLSDCQEELITSDCGFERKLIFKLNGTKAKITKFAAFVSENNEPDPVNGALGVVAAAARYPERQRTRHEQKWAELWKHDIEVGHAGLQKLVHNALFQLYCNLAESEANVPGPVGLAGCYWGGHAFWDDDLWMFPVLALMNPKLARSFVDYRFYTLDGARRNAVRNGYSGAQVAWESAEFGDETIPELIYAQQHHINSATALAQYQYYLITGDEDFLHTQAAEVITACADFWLSRAEYNSVNDRWEIKAVCCADEYAEIQDNNASTNYSAAVNLRLATLAARLTGRTENPEWAQVADKLWVPFDEHNQCFREFENYSGEIIKQADAVLLIYPWEMEMSDMLKRNTVEYYRNKYPPKKIMMGSSIDGIVAAELGDADAVWQSVLDLLPYFRGPFGIVSESSGNDVASFLTGLGGLLQLVVMGMGGVRIHEDGLTSYNPCLPSEVSHIKLHGIHHGGKCFDLKIQGNEVKITKR